MQIEKLKLSLNFYPSSKIKKVLKHTLGALAITFSLSQPAKADFTTNLIVNPAYSFFPGNIWHEVIGGDDIEQTKNPKLKKVIQENKKILEKFGIKNINQANKEVLELLYKFNTSKITTKEFLINFLNFGKKYNLTEFQTAQLLDIYIKNNFFEEKKLNKLNNLLKVNLEAIINFYGEQADSKLKEIIILYKNKQLDKKHLEEVLKEYLDSKEMKENIGIAMFIIFLTMLGILFMNILEL